MDPNILEISLICSSEASATQFAQNHGLLLNDQSIQSAQQPLGKCRLGTTNCPEIIADEMLRKKIKMIEDALRNEVVFFPLKTDRKQIDRQNDLNEERVYEFSKKVYVYTLVLVIHFL
ncbi:unnamed protein product [Rotaria sordida]|uniref:Uncharacterized protein n=1 Tax=Rotaria sordida TaxID=392033 RepID=A0A819A3G5_9BILA|nr:unnamed protein product [Rotaria sordida]CAF1255038.1 unnamed protein product [Rotaria sordida]CAF3606378.1 unnamed protein product [Rotaria sordida]CAF3776099.1 unnamed protein product [Rotaria sordida]